MVSTCCLYILLDVNKNNRTLLSLVLFKKNSFNDIFEKISLYVWNEYDFDEQIIFFVLAHVDVYILISILFFHKDVFTHFIHLHINSFIPASISSTVRLSVHACVCSFGLRYMVKPYPRMITNSVRNLFIPANTTRTTVWKVTFKSWFE